MKKIACLLLLLFTLMPAFQPAAAEVSVTLNLDRQEATLSDSIELQVRVSGAKRGDAPPAHRGAEAFSCDPRGGVPAGWKSSMAGIIPSWIIPITFNPTRKGVFRGGPRGNQSGGGKH